MKQENVMEIVRKLVDENTQLKAENKEYQEVKQLLTGKRITGNETIHTENIKTTEKRGRPVSRKYAKVMQTTLDRISSGQSISRKQLAKEFPRVNPDYVMNRLQNCANIIKKKESGEVKYEMA